MRRCTTVMLPDCERVDGVVVVDGVVEGVVDSIGGRVGGVSPAGVTGVVVVVDEDDEDVEFSVLCREEVILS